jgi:hypothetical protein
LRIATLSYVPDFKVVVEEKQWWVSHWSWVKWLTI